MQGLTVVSEKQLKDKIVQWNMRDNEAKHEKMASMADTQARRQQQTAPGKSTTFHGRKPVEPAKLERYLKRCTIPHSNEGSARSCSGSRTRTTNTGQKPDQSSMRRRRREDEDNQEQDNGDEREPKRPKIFLSPPQSQDDSAKFACPYRKRDPRKYCVQHWRPCALTPLESVARVKYVIVRLFIMLPC
jgi:hypothetical protein